MKLFRELYDSNFNYIKGYSSAMNNLKEWNKKCPMLLAISIDSDH